MVAAAALIVVALAAHTWNARPLAINWFYTRVFARFALDNPELLTSLRLLEPAGIRGHNGKFSDSSQAHLDANAAQLRDDLATLRSYDSQGYIGQDRLSYDIFEYFVNDRKNDSSPRARRGTPHDQNKTRVAASSRCRGASEAIDRGPREKWNVCSTFARRNRGSPKPCEPGCPPRLARRGRWTIA